MNDAQAIVLGFHDGPSVEHATGMTDRRRTMLKGYADAHGLTLEAAIDQYAVEAGIARYGLPKDIANAVALLFAPASRWITGTALRVEDGETKVL